MNVSKFYKKLTSAEVGSTKTHEIYIRMSNDFDYETFFSGTHAQNQSVIEVNFSVHIQSRKNNSLPASERELRFVYFANSNKEKRIPGLGNLFKDYEVEEGDVVCLERNSANGVPTYTLTFFGPNQVQVSPTCFTITQDIPESAIIQTLKVLPFEDPLQQIFYGAPGTGKSFSIDDLTDDYNSVRTTFHPDSDYASFVGAYKPTMENVPINSIYGESVQFAIGKNGHPGTEKKIVYKYVPQAFLKAYVAAWSNLNTPYFLIIEEINRGNCAQIFGDLFQLLDRNNAGSSSYAIHADEDISQFLRDDNKGFASLSDEQKNAIRTFVLHKDNGKTQAVGQDLLDGTLLLLPPNLYIWATMNTSDQSLFPIDSAFKRRWNWKYMPIEYHPIDKKTQQPIDWKFQIGDNIYSWGQFLSKINPEIYTLTESSDKQMGYFFAKADNTTGIISEDVFLNKVLFYLWTDVFKDFDVSSELFKNKDKNRSFIFTDFFDKDQPHALFNLIANFKLDIVDVDINSIEDDDSSEGETTENSQSQRDLSRYSINGEGKNNKRQTVLRSLRKYIEANPSLTAAEVIGKWNKVNPQLPYFILSASDYEARIADLPNQRDRFWSVTTGDGGKVYITNQWNANRINEFMRLVNNSDLGLNIEKVPE